MTRIIVGTDVSAQLHNLHTHAELCDESGRTLGRFVPLIDLSKWEPLSPNISDEELERRRKSNEPRSSLAEILACLEKK